MNTSHEPAPQTAAIERLARRRVQARMGWLTHATVYLAVIGGLSLLALLHQRHLPVGAAIGWGLALVIHGLKVVICSPISTYCTFVMQWARWIKVTSIGCRGTMI